MDEQISTLQLALIVGFVVVAVGFFLFLQSGGFLGIAVEKAIDDGRVIIGMSKDEVTQSWGRPAGSEDHSVRTLDIEALTTSTWIYKNPEREVHFSSDGTVIWVDTSPGD